MVLRRGKGSVSVSLYMVCFAGCIDGRCQCPCCSFFFCCVVTFGTLTHICFCQAETISVDLFIYLFSFSKHY